MRKWRIYQRAERRAKVRPGTLASFPGLWPVLDYLDTEHHRRYRRHVETHGLMCQECGGRGEIVDDYVEHIAITVGCGWCEGTGKVTRWMRGHWLHHKREEASDHG